MRDAVSNGPILPSLTIPAEETPPAAPGAPGLPVPGVARHCFRSVPAHRIVGGGLGRRYDHAARLSDRNFYGDHDHHPLHQLHHQSPAPTSEIETSGESSPPVLQQEPPAAAAAEAPPGHPGGRGVPRPMREPEPPRPPLDAGRRDAQIAGEGLGALLDREAGVDVFGSGGEERPCGARTGGGVGTLVSLCLETMVSVWESHSAAEYLPRAYHMPHELCARLLRGLVASRKLTALSLSGFLSPGALELDLSGCSYVPKSVFKQLGFSCPRIIHLNLSMCSQVNNAIVRSVLQGCSSLRQFYLDGCRHVTDAGFHLQQSPFYVLVGAVSLETISVQGCPQVTGELVLHLRKICRNLKELDLARCKSVSSASVRRVFDSCPSLESLNFSFLEGVVDEAFEGLPRIDLHGPEATLGGSTIAALPPSQEHHGGGERGYTLPVPRPLVTAPSFLPALRHLNLGRCSGVSDLVLATLGGAFPGLEGVHLEHCLRVTDAGVRALAAGCAGLRALGLRNCGQITDKALDALSVSCTSLEWVDLSWCGGVTDSGVLRLAMGCTGLEEVHAVWCENLTDASLSALSKFCMHLEALHLGGCSGVTACAVSALRGRGVEVFQ